jgi:hypothetical protein
MSWISPSTCSSSGLMGTSVAMARWIPSSATRWPVGRGGGGGGGGSSVLSGAARFRHPVIPGDGGDWSRALGKAGVERKGKHAADSGSVCLVGAGRARRC